MDSDDNYVIILGEIERLKKAQMNHTNLINIKKILHGVLFAYDMNESEGKHLIVPMLQLVSVLLDTNNIFY